MGPNHACMYKLRKSGHPHLKPVVGILSVGILFGWDFVRWDFVRWDFVLAPNHRCKCYRVGEIMACVVSVTGFVK